MDPEDIARMMDEPVPDKDEFAEICEICGDDPVEMECEDCGKRACYDCWWGRDIGATEDTCKECYDDEIEPPWRGWKPEGYRD